MSEPYLYTQDNPHAKLRANGKTGWFHPTRIGGTGAIRVIGIHTAETSPTTVSAEAVADFLRNQAKSPASYHSVVDNDSEVVLLPDEAVAFGMRGMNTPALHLSFATYAAYWGVKRVWDKAALLQGAYRAAFWCEKYDIPLLWLTRHQAINGSRGFIRHSIMDSNRRTDPGNNFPAVEFFDLIEAILIGDDKVLQEINEKLDFILTRLGGRYIPGSQGGNEQLNIGDDLKRVRQGLDRVELKLNEGELDARDC